MPFKGLHYICSHATDELSLCYCFNWAYALIIGCMLRTEFQQETAVEL